MVRYALLGLLRESNDYGYRLKRRFDERVGQLWNLNIGQVYQTLRSLQQAGLVSATEQGNDDHPARRVFRLTPEGSRVLEKWLHRRPSRPRPLRDETLIRLLFLDGERTAEALARIAEQERLYKKHMARLLAEKRRVGTGPRGAPLVRHLGLEAALLHAEAHLRWLEYCRQKLEAATGGRLGSGEAAE